MEKKIAQREINLGDLLVEFLRHWRIIICFILLTELLIGSFVFFKNTKAITTTTKIPISSVMQSRVDECIKDYNYIQSIRESLQETENIDDYSKMVEAEYYFLRKVNDLSVESRAYFYVGCGLKPESDLYTTSVQHYSLKTFLLIGLFLSVLLLIAIFTIIYIFDDKVKITDSLTSLYGIDTWELVDTEYYNSRKSLDKLWVKFRFSPANLVDKPISIKMISHELSLKIQNKYSKPTFVVLDTNIELNEFVSQLSSDSSMNYSTSLQPNLHFDTYEKLTHSDSVIIIVKANHTKHKSLYATIKKIQNNNKPILGIICLE